MIPYEQTGDDINTCYDSCNHKATGPHSTQIWEIS
jgi:hypothetical protein